MIAIQQNNFYKMKIAGCKPELNRIVAVQVSDTTMLIRELMFVTKKIPLQKLQRDCIFKQLSTINRQQSSILIIHSAHSRSAAWHWMCVFFLRFVCDHTFCSE